ncbi:hypothetical protein D6745_03305 [Candidatus Woesearchaeota archaeon]|nr:MAG: hypothetical protein D6745_03305 [Candidatus Woesearchaeota archaeon]
MQLTEERKEEIRRSVEELLEPYNGNLRSFTLQEERERLGIVLIGYSRHVSKELEIELYCIEGAAYIIAIHPSLRRISGYMLGHEIGHIQLGHLPARKVESPEDTPIEREEANYFSEYLNKRLSGINWLKGLKVENIDDLMNE